MKFSLPLEGAKDSLPVLLAYFSIGIATGALGTSNGMSVAEVGLLSLLVFAGASQFIFADLYRDSAAALTGTVFMVNLRHLLYSLTLAQHSRRLSLLGRVAVGAQITDESYLVATTKLGNSQIGGAGWICGLQICAHFTWISGNVLGAITGEHVDLSVLGVDFTATGMFIALIVLQIVGSASKARILATAALAGGASGCAAIFLPGAASPVIIAAIAAAFGVLIFGPSETDKEFAAKIERAEKVGKA